MTDRDHTSYREEIGAYLLGRAHGPRASGLRAAHGRLRGVPRRGRAAASGGRRAAALGRAGRAAAGAQDLAHGDRRARGAGGGRGRREQTRTAPPARPRPPLRERLRLPSLRPAFVMAALALGLVAGFGIAQLGGDDGSRTVVATVDEERIPQATGNLQVEGDGEDGAILRVNGMPALGGEQVYQAWVQRDGIIIPQPTFEVGPRRQRRGRGARGPERRGGRARDARGARRRHRSQRAADPERPAVGRPARPLEGPRPSSLSFRSMEVCYRHKNRETGVHCSNCGRPICPDCMTTTSVGMRCPECASQRTKVRTMGARSVGRAGAHLPADRDQRVVFLGAALGGASATGGGGVGGSTLLTDGRALALGRGRRRVLAHRHVGLPARRLLPPALQHALALDPRLDARARDRARPLRADLLRVAPVRLVRRAPARAGRPHRRRLGRDLRPDGGGGRRTRATAG